MLKTSFIHEPKKAANCCRNYRLAVDQDDLTWMKNCHVLVNQSHGKTPRCRKFGNSFGLQNDALMHHEGIKG